MFHFLQVTCFLLLEILVKLVKLYLAKTFHLLFEIHSHYKIKYMFIRILIFLTLIDI